MSPSPKPPLVRLHTAFQSRGGARRVAGLLHDGMAAMGLDVELSYEIMDDPGGPGLSLAPDQAGFGLGEGGLLHVHSSEDMPGLLASLTAKTPLVLTAHNASLITGGCFHPLDCPNFTRGCGPDCPQGHEGAAGVRADLRKQLERLRPWIVTPSRFAARLLRHDLPGLTVRTIPNAVPGLAGPGNKARARGSFGIPRKAKVLLFAAHEGTRARLKGGDKWEALFSVVRRLVPDAYACFMGEPDRKVLPDRLFLPELPPETLLRLMSAADLFMYPSLAENHPLHVLEAMAAGLPSAAFAVGGVPEQIDHGRTGILAEPGDFPALAMEAAGLLQDPLRLAAMGKHARAAWSERFQVEGMVNAHVSMYECLAGGATKSRVRKR